MSVNDKNKPCDQDNVKSGHQTSLTRRDVLKGIATLPMIGAVGLSAWEKKRVDEAKKNRILKELGLDRKIPEGFPSPIQKKPGDLLRLGIIGYGSRGEQLVRGTGFAHPDFFEFDKEEDDPRAWENRVKTFMNQDNLNVVLTGVCDIFEVREDRGVAASKNSQRPGNANGPLQGAKRYHHYQDMLESNEIDAVIIATPDHWHAQMTVDALNAGKHVYCEKCMTRTEEEVYDVMEAANNSDAVYQLGHQGPQFDVYQRARQIVKKNILGKITLVEATTNRNSPNGAWVYGIHDKASPETIDWEQFQGPAPNKVPFSLERFFRWRCWFDYGTGLTGDLFSHEYNTADFILDLGIPKSVMASGGIYFFKDGRDVPDVFQVVCEYPDRELTFIYSATLANSHNRGLVFMGHDAAMEVGNSVIVSVDYDSTQYEEKIKDKLIDTNLPLFTYKPGAKGIDTVTSATERYFATKGLMFTYIAGHIVNLDHLHIKDWLDCIRTGNTPACDIEAAFREGITCHMATRSYRERRKVEWDPIQKRIV